MERESKRAFPMKFVPPKMRTLVCVSIFDEMFIIDVWERVNND